MAGDNGRKGGKGFQKQLQRTHGQKNKGKLDQEWEVGMAGMGGVVVGKWGQLYLNNNKV